MRADPKSPPLNTLTRRTFMAGTVAAAVTTSLAACAAQPAAVTSSSTALVNIVAEGSNSFVRTFNPFSPTTRWTSLNAMYEPLMIANSAAGKVEPWLATSYAWSDDGLTLTLHLRSGVKWSDGKPFTADDVVYTFNLMSQNKALIGPANVALSSLKSVTANGGTVEFVLGAPNSTVVSDLTTQFIVPKHIWSGVGDPVKYVDATPVATGPYTTVKSFTTQQYEVTRNPHYWQKLKVAGLRLKAYSGNDQISAAVVSGQVDWGGLVPNPDSTFVAKDPKHNHYWWPTTGALFLIANATNPLLADSTVRKAISMSLDRKGMIQSAVWGKSTPANGVGLMPDGSKQWIYDPAVKDGADWVTKDTSAANKLLDDAGYAKGSDGVRVSKDGTPLKFTIAVPGGYSDWVSDCQIISQNAKAIGIDITTQTPSADAWTTSTYTGKFDLTLFAPTASLTPYLLYHQSMGSDTVQPIGTATAVNSQRFSDPQATTLLDQFTKETDTAAQKDTMNQLQSRFAEIAPMIPLYGAPDWGLFTTKRFTGFPDASNPYAPLTLGKGPSTFLVYPHLSPVA